MQQKGSCKILSTGVYLPSNRVKPSDMVSEVNATQYGIADTFIEDSLGILEVRHADTEKPSDMAIVASHEALAKTDINFDHIDLIVFCGIEGDYAEPSTAHYVQHALGLKGICFDVSNACLGFATGIQVANDMIACGSVRYALVCTGERSSSISKAAINLLLSRNNVDLFRNTIGAFSVGDVGGAVVLGPSQDQKGIISFRSRSVGRHADLCYYKIVGDVVDGKMYMGRISREIIAMHKSIYHNTLDDLDWSPDDIDICITHQVGQRPFQRLRETFGLDQTKMTQTYHHYGNLTSGTFAANICQAIDYGMAKASSKVFVALTGSGLSVTQIGVVL